MSSPGSRARALTRRADFAKKCQQVLSWKAGFGDDDPRSIHSGLSNPVSSRNSRCAASFGLSPGSMTPPGISVVIDRLPKRYWRTTTTRASSVMAITFTHGRVSKTSLVKRSRLRGFWTKS